MNPVRDKPTNKKIDNLLSRGVEEVIFRESLEQKLKSGRKLRIKHGIDPTGPKIHLGRAVQFWKLREFQDLGHQIVLIIGDFTAQIGDASDKVSARRPLSAEEVEKNIKNYEGQIGKILDMRKTELRYNSEWLKKMSAVELINLSMHFTAQQLIQRRNFKERWERGKEIGLHELDYPLLQGYDSVAVRADVEIGGSDQLFNLKTGRKVQEIFHQEPQDIMTLEMLYGLDGRKMSTTWGNVINIVDPYEEQYGKIMSMKDELIVNYFKLATRLPMNEIEEIDKLLKFKKINPRDAKARLAREIVSIYYGKKASQKTEAEFERIFKKKQLPINIPEMKLPKAGWSILELLVKTKLAFSKAEAKRLIEQRGVRINNEVQTDWKKTIVLRKGKDIIIQVGKRKFVKIIL